MSPPATTMLDGPMAAPADAPAKLRNLHAIDEAEAVLRERKQAAAEVVEKEMAEDEDASESTAADSAAPPASTVFAYPPLSWIAFLGHLFFSRRFIVHRQFGLWYLVQWAAVLYFYITDYKYFKDSFLVWSLPLTGVIQSVTAIYTFTFLPKKAIDQGYFSDKKTMTYPFIVENSFFAGLLFFQWVYYNDYIYTNLIKPTFVIEAAVVFIPYIFRDMFWPKTSFRDSYVSKQNRTEKNQFFFSVAITVTKAFYIWAKHYIGFFLNYARFLDRPTEIQTYHIYLCLIFSAFATTIAMFLHTLKFRKYIGPRTAFLVYAASYTATFYTFVRISDVFWTNMDLTLITLGGLALNFSSREVQHAYQLSVMVLMFASRLGHLPANLQNVIGLQVGH